MRKMKKITIALILVVFVGLGGVHAEEVSTDLEDMAYPQEFSDTVYTLEIDKADMFISICGLSEGSYSIDTPNTTHGEFSSNGGLVDRLEIVPGNYTIETHGSGVIQLHDARLTDFLDSHSLSQGESLSYSLPVNGTTSFFGVISGIKYDSEYMVSVDGAKRWALYDLCGRELETVQTGDLFSLVVEVDEPSEVTFGFHERSSSTVMGLLSTSELLLVILVLIPAVAYGWYRVLAMRKRNR